jgi:hypothetical protein
MGDCVSILSLLLWFCVQIYTFCVIRERKSQFNDPVAVMRMRQGKYSLVLRSEISYLFYSPDLPTGLILLDPSPFKYSHCVYVVTQWKFRLDFILSKFITATDNRKLACHQHQQYALLTS